MKKNLLLGLLVLITAVSFGQKIPFQGKLIENGAPVNGPKTFEFSIASPAWSETHSGISVTDGLYFVVLGSINPLPDSLFYGVEEQQLSISVEGVALSAVTLFKPISSPFEGSELVVHNDEGTKVGEMKALSTDVNKNGEVNVFGTNGSKNITLGGLSHWQSPGNDFGWMYLSNDEDLAKAILGVTPYRGVHGTGEFTLKGETNGVIHQGFNSIDSIWDFPYLLMKSKLTNGGNARIEIMKSDTTEFGELELSSNAGNQVLINPNSVSLNNNSGETLIKLRTDNGFGKLVINGEGNGAIRTPFNINSITGKHEFPGVTLFHNGNTYGNYYTTQNDSVVKGIMYLNSSIGESNISGPNSFYLVKDGKIMSQYRFHDWGGNGFSAYQRMNGPNSQNFEFGGKHWVNPDLPYFRMNGSQNQYALEMSVYDDSTETAYVNLNSLNGNSTGLRAGGVDYRGPNSKNVDMGGKSWENEDFGFINMWGSNDFHAMDISVSEDENGDQFGYINMMSQNGKSLHLSPEGFGVDKISLNTINNTNGSSGEVFIHGNTTPNIQMGGQSWDNHDLGFFQVFGNIPNGNGWYYSTANISANTDGINSWGNISLNYNDMQRITLDGQSGGIESIAEDASRTFMTPNEIALVKSDWSAVANLINKGDYGVLQLKGPSTDNISMGGGQNGIADRPYFNMNGENDFHAVDLTVSDDGANQLGALNLRSEDGKLASYDPTGLWMDKARIDNGSFGQLKLSGPNSENFTFEINGGNQDMPWFGLFGSNDFNLMHITGISGGNEFGYMHLMTEDGFSSNVNPYRTLNESNDGRSGYFGHDRSTFNDNGQELTVNAHSISGTGTIQLNGNFNVNGVLTLNGDTIDPGVSDRRYKKNIQSLGENVLNKVELVEGVSYDWRKEEFPEKHFTNSKQIGVIAQELEAQFPELVKTNAEGYKSVNYNGFTAVLLEAVKELNSKVENLEIENMQLKAQLVNSAETKTELEQLKAQVEGLVKIVQANEQSKTATENVSLTSALK